MFENAKIGDEVTTGTGSKGIFVKCDILGSAYPYHIELNLEPELGRITQYTVNNQGRFAMVGKSEELDVVSIDSPVPAVMEEIEIVDVTLEFTPLRIIVKHPDGLIVQIIKTQVQEIRDKQVLLCSGVIYSFTKDTTELITAWLLDEEYIDSPEVFLVDEVDAEDEPETVGSEDESREEDYNTPVPIGYGTKE